MSALTITNRIILTRLPLLTDEGLQGACGLNSNKYAVALQLVATIYPKTCYYHV